MSKLLSQAPDTTSADLRSWVDSANHPDSPFPIQNLPWGRFRRDAGSPWSIGVAIGQSVLDVVGAGFLDTPDVAALLALPRPARREWRAAISSALSVGSPSRKRLEPWLHAMHDVELGLPCDIRNFSDFFIGIHHAERAGQQLRPGSALPANYRWVPIGYHGRASSVQASGTDFTRPKGQVCPPGSELPVLAPTRKLDFELEMGVLITHGNRLGETIDIASAEDHIAGLTLLNDWSARDIQRWEAQPLGPFLAKSFATTLSPWVVTLEALAPFRRPLSRPPTDPASLAYLDDEKNRQTGAFDVTLEVWLQTAQMRTRGHPGDRIVTTNFAQAAYWTVAQLVTHHTINGCNLQPGDLLGTGTLSGPLDAQSASLLEITGDGTSPLLLSNGEQRTYLQDGDTVTLQGYCERAGFRRIGFGECRATVLPAHQGVSRQG